jgi:hypothetical protein
MGLSHRTPPVDVTAARRCQWNLHPEKSGSCQAASYACAVSRTDGATCDVTERPGRSPAPGRFFHAHLMQSASGGQALIPTASFLLPSRDYGSLEQASREATPMKLKISRTAPRPCYFGRQIIQVRATVALHRTHGSGSRSDATYSSFALIAAFTSICQSFQRRVPGTGRAAARAAAAEKESMARW